MGGNDGACLGVFLCCRIVHCVRVVFDFVSVLVLILAFGLSGLCLPAASFCSAQFSFSQLRSCCACVSLMLFLFLSISLSISPSHTLRISSFLSPCASYSLSLSRDRLSCSSSNNAHHHDTNQLRNVIFIRILGIRSASLLK